MDEARAPDPATMLSDAARRLLVDAIATIVANRTDRELRLFFMALTGMTAGEFLAVSGRSVGADESAAGRNTPPAVMPPSGPQAATETAPVAGANAPALPEDVTRYEAALFEAQQFSIEFEAQGFDIDLRTVTRNELNEKSLRLRTAIEVAAQAHATTRAQQQDEGGDKPGMTVGEFRALTGRSVGDLEQTAAQSTPAVGTLPTGPQSGPETPPVAGANAPALPENIAKYNQALFEARQKTFGHIAGFEIDPQTVTRGELKEKSMRLRAAIDAAQKQEGPR